MTPKATKMLARMRQRQRNWPRRDMDQELLIAAKALAARDYQVIVEREEGPNGNATWVAYMSDMPSCVAEGESAQAAKSALKNVSEDYIYFRLKRGVPVPDPQLSPLAPARDNTGTERPDATAEAPSNVGSPGELTQQSKTSLLKEDFQ